MSWTGDEGDTGEYCDTGESSGTGSGAGGGAGGRGQRAKAMKAFKAFDADADGNITLVELKEVLQMLDPVQWTDKNVKEFLDHLDTNRDGQIQYTEFLDYICEGTPTHRQQVLSDEVTFTRNAHHEFLNAAKNYDWDVVRSKVEAQPKLINVRPCGRWSALHQAAAAGDAGMVSWLLAHNADVGVQNRSNQTPLMVASGGAVALLEGKSPAEEVDEEAMQTAAEHALLDDAKFYRWDAMKETLNRSPKMVNVQPCGRWSCLHQAVEQGDKEVVNFLLSKKADVTLVTKDGSTALDLAQRSKDPALIEMITAAGPHEACPHGCKCGDFTEEHRQNYSHPGAFLSKQLRQTAKDKYGGGQWEFACEHIRSEDGWCPLATTFEGDWALYNYAANGGERDAMLLVSNVEEDYLPRGWSLDPPVQQAKVDMKDLYLSLHVKKSRRGKVTTSTELFGIRRTGSTVHPRAGIAKHPFEEKLERDRDVQDGFLTNKVFYRTFCKAVEMGKDVLSSNERLHYEKWLKDNFEEDELFDYQYNADWMKMSPGEAPLERRGGVLYKTPAGWKRIALKVWDKYDDGDNTWLGMEGKEGEWAVAYHGCAMAVVPLIMKGGFRVGTGQGARNCIETRTGRKVGDGVYCSPNIRVVECYANGNEDGASENKTDAVTVDGRTLFFAFQCRVRPGAINRPDRHFARCNDEEVMGIDGVFEWIINNPDDIRPYAILVREKEGSDHRSLGQLIGNKNWNKNHKPLPFGSFDKIPGRIANPKEIQDSYLRAQKALL